MYIYRHTPETQMILVLIGQDLVLEGLTPKIEDNQVPGVWWLLKYLFLSSPLYTWGPDSLTLTTQYCFNRVGSTPPTRDYTIQPNRDYTEPL